MRPLPALILGSLALTALAWLTREIEASTPWLKARKLLGKNPTEAEIENALLRELQAAAMRKGVDICDAQTNDSYQHLFGYLCNTSGPWIHVRFVTCWDRDVDGDCVTYALRYIQTNFWETESSWDQAIADLDAMISELVTPVPVIRGRTRMFTVIDEVAEPPKHDGMLHNLIDYKGRSA